MSIVESRVGSEQVELCFCYDSLTAGSQASGQWHAFSEPLVGHFLRSMHKCIEQRFQALIKYVHAKAHVGEPGNELVDTLAHQAALGEPLHDLDSWIRMTTKCSFVQNAEWFWHLFREDVQWEGQALLLPAAPATDVLQFSAKQESVDETTEVPEIGTLDLALATCNVLSLLPRDAQKNTGGSSTIGPARLDCILQQMEEEKVHVFALQETRLRKSSNAHDSRFWLYRANATSQGHYGIIVGFARARPIGTIHGSTRKHEVFIEQDDVALIASDPRFLILRLKTALVHAIIIAGHAPHTGAAASDLARWWEDLAQHIPSRYDLWPRVLLVDANARVGSEPCQHIGPHQAEGGNGKEEAFVQFVRKQGLFLPATFPACHFGDGGTWRHAQGTWSRNDYIGIPVEWNYESCCSYVSTLIDAGLAKEDHKAPIVHLVRQAVIHKTSKRSRPVKLQLDNFDPESLVAAPTYPWGLDVHAHTQQLQDDLVDMFWTSRQTKPSKPIKKTMSEGSWGLVRQKRASRNTLAAYNRSQRLTALSAWFACWKHAINDMDLGVLAVAFDQLLRQQDILIAVEYHHFRLLGRQVVKALRNDDIKFYDNLLQDCTAFLEPKQVKGLWNVVRRSLPKFQQRRMSTPPFQIEGFEDQWASHFCQLEAGRSVTLQELHKTCFTRQLHCLFDAPRELHVSQLPSLFLLEDAFRQTQPDRATGNDPLPSVLFHKAAKPLAGLYHDLLIKEYIWQMEPLQHKGGPVAIVPKCLVPTSTAQFRGILLLGNMAKRTHSVIRKQLMSHLERARAPGQLGGFPGQQVMFGSQALQLFCNMADAKGVSSAVLFLDLSNAFHHLVRELVTGISLSASLDVVLETLASTQHPAEKIRAACSLPGLLEQLGAPSCLVRLLRDIHAETWCSLPDHTVLHTHRGTRPGSPLADIIFQYFSHFNESHCRRY